MSQLLECKITTISKPRNGFSNQESVLLNGKRKDVFESALKTIKDKLPGIYVRTGSGAKMNSIIPEYVLRVFLAKCASSVLEDERINVIISFDSLSFSFKTDNKLDYPKVDIGLFFNSKKEQASFEERTNQYFKAHAFLSTFNKDNKTSYIEIPFSKRSMRKRKYYSFITPNNDVIICTEQEYEVLKARYEANLIKQVDIASYLSISIQRVNYIIKGLKEKGIDISK